MKLKLFLEIDPKTKLKWRYKTISCLTHLKTKDLVKKLHLPIIDVWLKSYKQEQSKVFALTWLSRKKCVACSSCCFGLVRFRVTSFLFEMTHVSFVHYSWTRISLSFENAFNLFFLRERSNCETLKIYKDHYHIKAWWMFFLMVPNNRERVLTPTSLLLKTSLLIVAYSNTPLWANALLECDLFMEPNCDWKLFMIASCVFTSWGLR